MAELNSTDKLTIEVDGVKEELSRDDLLIEAVKSDDYVSDSDYGITVVLDIKLTPELVEEGFVREVISKLQTMRKDSDFEVMDHIKVYESGNDKIKSILEANAEYVKGQVLAEEIVFDADCENLKEWNINGEKVNLGVERV